MTSVHSAIIVNPGGLLYTSGSNSKGQLGQDTYNHANEFSRVATPSYIDLPLYHNQIEVKMVSSGSQYSLFIDNHNLLWGFGSNSEGQLGIVTEDTPNCLIDTSILDKPTKLPTLNCTKQHVPRIRNDILPPLNVGITNKTQKHSMSDQNGNSITRSRYVITHQITKIKSLDNFNVSNEHIESDDSNMNWNPLYFRKPIPINSMKGIECKSIDCGTSFSVVLDKNGSLWTCGSNEYGQLCVGDNIRRNEFTKVSTIDIYTHTSPHTIVIDKISAGSHHLLVIDDCGTVWCSGDNRFSQLGIHSSHLTNSNTLIRFGVNHSSIQNAMVNTDCDFINNRNNLPYNEPITDISCGYSHSLLQSRFSHKIWISGSIIPRPIDRIDSKAAKTIQNFRNGINWNDNYNKIPISNQLAPDFDSIFNNRHVHYNPRSLIRNLRFLDTPLTDNCDNIIDSGDTIHGSTTYKKSHDMSTVRIVSMITKSRSSFFIDSNRRLWVLGDNSKHQLGINTSVTYYDTPSLHPSLIDIDTVIPFGTFTFVKLLSNISPCLINSGNECNSPRKTTLTHQQHQKEHTNDQTTTDCGTHGVELPDLADINSCTSNNSCNNRKLSDKFKRLIISSPREKYTKGDSTTIMGFGNNDYGQLGLGDNITRPYPVEIPALSCNNATQVFNYTTGLISSGNMNTPRSSKPSTPR